jgi:uncharacterized hydrophobic protein (TIGR00271 family)
MERHESTERPARLERWLRIEQHDKANVYSRVAASTDLSSLAFWIEIVCSAALATLGLVLDSPAVIVGAMLISPLMAPIMATGLALAAGDLYLGVKALLTLAASVAAALLVSAALVWALPFHSPTSEILARTHPDLLDLVIALLSGLAGAVVAVRGGAAAGITSLPGVAIAVALMPPICVAGFGFASGLGSSIAAGSLLLFLTNLAAIVGSGFLVFFLVRMGDPSVREGLDRSRRSAGDRLFRVLERIFPGSGPAEIGRLRWRALLVVVLLASVFVPLRKAFRQVTEEIRARRAVQEVLAKLAPAESLVSQRVHFGPDRIDVRVVSTAKVSPASVERTRKRLAAETGRQVELAIQEVASRAELEGLLDRMAAPASAAATEQRPLDEVRRELVAEIETPLRDTWPASVPLRSFELGIGAAGTVLHVTYEAVSPLGGPEAETLRQVLRQRLGSADLTLDLAQVPSTGGSPGTRTATPGKAGAGSAARRTASPGQGAGAGPSR